MPVLVRAAAKARCVVSPTAMGRGGVSAAVRPGLGLRLSGVRLHVDQIRKNQAGKCPAYARSAKRSCSAIALSARGSSCEIYLQWKNNKQITWVLAAASSQVAVMPRDSH